MKNKHSQKIKSGLLILAKIIAREEIKNESDRIDKFVIFPSTRNVIKDNFIEYSSRFNFKNSNKIIDKVKCR